MSIWFARTRANEEWTSIMKDNAIKNQSVA